MLIYILLNGLILISGYNFNIRQGSSNVINETLVLAFIRNLHEYYEYENFVFVVSANLTIADDFWSKLPMVPQLVITNAQFAVRPHIDTPAICIIFTTGREDAVMELAASDMIGLHQIMTVFVLYPLVELYRYQYAIADLAKWIWKSSYIYAAIITVYNNVYQVKPYPRLRIVNKTLNWMPEDFRSKRRPNLKGYTIETPICYDLPRVFLNKNDVLSGSSGRLFQEFLNYINATLKRLDTCPSVKEPNDVPTILQMIEDNSIDVSVNSFTQMKYKAEGGSYPTAIDDYCVMVPSYYQPQQHLYLQVLLDKYMYMLLVFSTIYIAFTLWLCTPGSHRNQRDFSLCVLEAISTLLSLPPLNRFNMTNVRMRIVLILISILGFTLVNVYVTELTSMLATTITNSPIKTVEDAIKANLQILVVAYEYPTVKDSDFPSKFLALITQVNRSVIDEYREDLNTAYGYFIQSDRWQFLKQQQRYLNKPLFHMSSICLGPYVHLFPLSSNSHITEPLSDFIVLSSEIGLRNYWSQQTFHDALLMDYVDIKIAKDELSALAIEFYTPILSVWCIGLTISLIIFLYEIKGHICKICRINK